MARRYTDNCVPWAAVFEPPSLAPEYIGPMLDCLVAINGAWLDRNPKAPMLYSCGVVYRREPKGQERWASIPTVLALGYGDCEDLACWRTAELQRLGEAAHAIFTHKMTPSGVLYHIKVRRADGSIEDPSKKLGMGNSDLQARIVSGRGKK